MEGTQQIAEEKSPQVASLGTLQRTVVNLNANNQENIEANQDSDAGAGEKDKGTGDSNQSKTPEINDEVLKEYFKAKGIEYEGEEKLKEKLNFKPQAEPTEEEKLEKAKAKEKRLLDKWIANKGTVEQYVAMKNIADADVKELSVNAVKKELKDAKFSDEEIEQIMKQRYYQFDDDEIEQEEDESDRDFKKRLKEYGAKKLANRSLHTKKQMQEILAGLNKAVEEEDLDAQEEQTISANIDEKFKTVQLRDTFEVGKINDVPILPIESEVDQSEIAEISKLLKDPEKRNNLLFHPDGSLNLNNIADVLIENKKLKSAIKASYHEGSTRTNDEWEKVFPSRTAYAIGIGGSSNKAGQNNKPASFGKNQRVNLPSST